MQGIFCRFRDTTKVKGGNKKWGSKIAKKSKTASLCLKLRDNYDKFLEKNEGSDPDFPGLEFNGGKNGQRLSGQSKYRALHMGDEVISSDRGTWDPRFIDSDWSNYTLTR